MRIREDAASSGQECGEALDSVLRRSLSRRLSSIVLSEENNSSIPRQYQARESVITRTPTRLAATSTPSSSPNPPPIPPKKCQNLVPPIPTRSRSCSLSKSCSDVSSIQGEVFIDGEVDIPVPSFEAVPKPETILTIAMEEAESDLIDRTVDLKTLMNNFDVVDVNQETIHDYKEKLAEINDAFKVTVREIERHIRIYSNKGLDPQNSQHWQKQVSQVQSDVRNHRDKIIAKVLEVKASVTAVNNANNGAHDTLEAEKLELKKRKVAAQKAMSISNSNQINQTIRETDERRNHSLIEARAKAAKILTDVDELDKSVNETTDWKNATDVTVKKAVRNIENWKKEMNKISERSSWG